MIGAEIAGTSLPNLHPAVVHFPVALFLTALLFDVACLLVRRARWLDPAAAALYALAAISAVVAYRAGRAAEDSLVGIAPAIEPLLAEHADWAWWTVWAFTTVAAVRVAIAWSDRHLLERGIVTARLAVLAAALAGAWLLFETAEHGGALVYRHGVAVAGAAGPSTPESRPETAMPPATPAAPVAEPPIEMSGTSRHMLSGSFGDVQIEARVDLGRFAGAFRIVHHLLDPESAGYFEVATAGKAVLLQLSPAGRKVLDEAEIKLPSGPVTLTLSSSGSHLKGMIDGKVVVHGHAAPGPPGQAGFALDGSGTIRILHVTVTPLPPP